MDTSTASLASTVIADARSPRPVRFPAVSEVERLLANCPELGRLLSDAMPAVEARLAGLCDLKGRLRAIPQRASARPERTLALGCAYAIVDLSMTGECAILEVELPTLASLLAHVAGSEPTLAFASELTRIEEAAFGYICLELLSAVRQQPLVEARLAPRLIDVTLDRSRARGRLDPASRYVSVRFERAEAGAACAARLVFPARILTELVSGHDTGSEERLPPVLETLPYPVQLRFGTARLPTASVASLRRGDVVLLDGPTIRKSRLLGQGTLSCGRHAWRVEAAAHGLHILHAQQVHPTEGAFVNQTGQMNPELCVEVEVELASLRLRLGELSNLRPGSVLPLHVDVNEPVLVRVANQTFARASLVDLDGRLGARIVELMS